MAADATWAAVTVTPAVSRAAAAADNLDRRRKELSIRTGVSLSETTGVSANKCRTPISTGGELLESRVNPGPKERVKELDIAVVSLAT
ncbi:hypothetical protein IL992_13765 [Microbispora sp. NEAU-D428]|uniref:hypothetical protein n=1 Tax=Microbispora sitophila TaxID=2771537 RepID=UPI00186747CA|nr:hypothetical protein [Microbispora sitophila]MBE3010252.1 hypothetical protein [Microbispora sitophila]